VLLGYIGSEMAVIQSENDKTAFSDVAMVTLSEYHEKYKHGNWLFMGMKHE
jgi:hypothetical protein